MIIPIWRLSAEPGLRAFWWQLWWQKRGFEVPSGDRYSFKISNLLIPKPESMASSPVRSAIPLLRGLAFSPAEPASALVANSRGSSQAPGTSSRTNAWRCTAACDFATYRLRITISSPRRSTSRSDSCVSNVASDCGSSALNAPEKRKASGSIPSSRMRVVLL